MISIEKKWYALRTKFRSEKIVRDRLLIQDIEAYVPLFVEKKQYVRKLKIVEKPLIASYVFVYISKAEYATVLKTLGVGSFLKIGKEIYPIPENEIETLKKIVGEFRYEEVALEDYALEQGDVVEIIGGKLTGVKGIISKEKRNKKIVINLASIGKALSFEIDAKYVQKLNA